MGFSYAQCEVNEEMATVAGDVRPLLRLLRAL